MKNVDNEIHLSGTPISDGVAIGRLYLISQDEQPLIPEFSIEKDQVDKEISRYRNALSSSREDLIQLQGFLSDEGTGEASSIIDTHIQMLEDPFITTFIEKKIRSQLQNTESVFRSVMGEYEKKFVTRGDQYFQQRLIDVKDLSCRILKHLYPTNEGTQHIPFHAVLCAKEFVPSHTAEACVSKVSAFLSEIGGATSHAALIARSKGIPFVANLNYVKLKKHEGSLIIIDGTSGKVIVNPSGETLKKFQQIKDGILEDYEQLIQELEDEPFEQADLGVKLFANVANISDIDSANSCRAQGIGLFRTEFLFLQDNLFEISEEEQFEIYLQVINKASDLPVTFRFFDFGSDKGLYGSDYPEEPNPALGCRATRFLLKEKVVFERQVRALLRASQYGKMKLMFPLIMDLEEFNLAKNFVLNVMGQLLAEGKTVDRSIPIGCMIEVPSAALTSDLLAGASDFFSIGTNDLLQYTLAVDRANPIVTDLYYPAHPSILRLIRLIVDNAKAKGKEVYVCGEMASSPLFVEMLLGLGIRKLSCAPRHIPWTRNMLRKIDLEDAREFATHLLSLSSTEMIEEAIKKRHEELTSV